MSSKDLFRGDPTALSEEWDKCLKLCDSFIDQHNGRLQALYGHLEGEGADINLERKKMLDYSIGKEEDGILKWMSTKTKMLDDRFALDRDKIETSEFITLMIKAIIKLTLPYLTDKNKKKWDSDMRMRVDGKNADELREYLND